MTHKLLQRQINKYLGNIALSQELDTFLSVVDEAYCEYDKENQFMEHSLDLTSREMTEINDHLTTLISQINKAHTHIIQQEKMAVLGQLIAGVAHEVNTPAGAIQSSSLESLTLFNQVILSFMKLPSLLSQDDIERYYKICAAVLSFKENLTTTETRSLAKNITPLISPHISSDPRRHSRTLASIGFDEKNIYLLDFVLKHPNKIELLESLYDLGNLRIALQNISAAIGNINHIIYALKSYGSNATSTEKKNTNIVQDIRNTLIIMKSKLRGVEVETNFPEDEPTLFCHAERLSQVWTNLINNAFDAMGWKGKVIISVYSHQEELEVRVEDFGSGIDPKLKDKIFETYFTSKGEKGGMGIGLSLCREIVEEENGTISFESSPGRTTFIVRLPTNKKELH